MNSVTRKSFEDTNSKRHLEPRCSQRLGAKIASIVVILFSLPNISPAQRWDKLTSFPLQPSFYTGAINTITSGPDGALWYTDNSREVVGRMTTTGATAEYYICCGPQGITTGPDASLWFAETSRSGNRIGRVTP